MSLARTLLCVGLLAAHSGSCNGEDSAPPREVPRPAPKAPSQEAVPSQEARESFDRARHFFSVEDPVQAAEHLRRAVELAPDWPEARLGLGKLLMTLCAVRFSTATFDRACLEQAVVELERACALKPQNAEAAYWAGRALGKVPRIPEALARLETAISLDPAHGPAFKELGLLCAAEGDLARSEEYLTRARELLPKDDEILLQLGMQLESGEQLEEAKAAFLEAVRLNPAHPGPLTRLVWIYQRLGDAEAAQRTSAELTRCKDFGKRLTQATQRFEAIRRDSGAALGVAELYHEVGLSTTARAWAERALRLDANNAGASELLRKMGLDPKAALAPGAAGSLEPESDQ